MAVVTIYCAARRSCTGISSCTVATVTNVTAMAAAVRRMDEESNGHPDHQREHARGHGRQTAGPELFGSDPGPEERVAAEAESDCLV